MIVFVRFEDDMANPSCTQGHQDWPHDQAEPDYADDFLAPTTNPATFSSYRLTDYYYEQSQENFILYGDTYGVQVGQHTVYNGGGDVLDLNQLSEDVIDSLDVSGVDFSDYDDNNDGFVDHVFIVVRNLMGLTITINGASGISELGPGFSCLNDRDGVSFDCEYSGSINNAQPILPQVDLTRLLAHEFGHDLWRDFFVHIDPIEGNFVPQPTGDENPDQNETQEEDADEEYGYALMNGGNIGNQVLGATTISAFERYLLDDDWEDCTALTGDQTVTLSDLYTSGECSMLSLDTGRTLFISNRQRSNYFDQNHTATTTINANCPGCLDIEEYQGLHTTGLLIALVEGDDNRDVLPADNGLDIYEPCDLEEGDGVSINALYEGDLYGPNTRTQITPWTRPNITGCTGYDDGTDCDVDEALSWAAIDDIRSGSGTDLVFDFIDDFRTDPVVREDSWIGAETDGETISGDLVVQAGATLTIEPGTTLEFASGTGIIVYGNLNMDDVTLIASSTSWDGIAYRNGSSGTIENSTIERTPSGAGGATIIVDNADVTIENSYVENAYSGGGLGMAVWAFGTSTVELFDNTLYADEGPAVLLAANTDANIQDNDIVLSSSATEPNVHAENYAAAFFVQAGVDSNRGLNKLLEGSGLYARDDGLIHAGTYASANARNHFCDSGSATLEVEFGGTLHARYNYWSDGSNPTQTNNGGTIYFSNNLGAADCSDVSLRVVATPVAAAENNFTTDTPFFSIQQDEEKDVQKLFIEALEKARAGQYAEAIALFKQIVEHGVMPESHSALLELGHVFKKTEHADVLPFFETLARQEKHPLRTTVMGLLAHAYAQQERIDEALAMLDDIRQAYPETPEAYASRASAFLLYLTEGRTDEAAQILSTMQPRDKRDERMLEAYQRLLERETSTDPGISRKQDATSQTVAKNPDIKHAAAMVDVKTYPNPFNPATTIRYTLPTSSTVVLKIYDVLGREVATLVDGVQQVGTHEAIFDASNLPSGTYLYRLEVGGFSQTGRMLLLK